MRIVKLPITVGSKPFEKIVMLDFIVVEEKSPYQIILGRPFMRASQCVISTHYLALKYRVNGVVGVVNGDQMMMKSCYATAAKEPYKLRRLIAEVIPRRVARNQLRPWKRWWLTRTIRAE